MSPEVVKIYSENSEFQQIEALRRNRTKRRQRKEFFVEGVRLINQAIDHAWEITSLIFTREKRLSDWAVEVIGKSGAKKHVEVPLNLLKKISQKEDISEIIAIVKMPPDDLSRIPVRENSLILVLDRPVYPNNIGTIIRSCDALRVDGVVITGHSADLYDPETVRATTGSFFCIPTVRLPSHNELIPWINDLRKINKKLQIVGTSEDGERLIQEHDFTVPTILLSGNETRGLSESYKSLCNTMVAIPMYGYASSFNVASATSIVLYEIDRQRREVTLR